MTSPTVGSNCALDNFKNDPFCRLVLVEYSGDLVSKFPNMPADLHGKFRNSYYPDGKLQGITFYSDKDADHPQTVTSFSYTRDGNLLTAYSTIASKGDGVMDTKKEVLYTWQNGKLINFTDRVGPIDESSQTPARGEIHPAVPMGSGISIGMGIIWEVVGFNNPVMTGGGMIFKFFNSEDLLESYKHWDSVTSLAEVKDFTYINKKFQNVVDRFYDCTNQPNKFCFDATPQYALLPGLQPYLEINTTWTYQDGKLTQIYSAFDGDLDPHGNHAGVNQTLDYEWNCTITYDNNIDQKVIAALSPDMDPWGLPNDEKMKSMTCDDKGAGFLSGQLNFDKWVYLWQAIPGGQEPGS